MFSHADKENGSWTPLETVHSQTAVKQVMEKYF